MSNITRNPVWVAGATSYLMERLSQVDPDTLAKINAGNIEIVQTSFYARRLVGAIAAGKTVTDVIDSSVVKTPGITKFENGQLPKNTYLSINAVSLAYGIHATNPDQARYSSRILPFVTPADATTQPADQIPLLLQNAEVELWVENFRIFNLPAKKFFIDGFSTAEGTTLVSTLQLETPKIIPPEKNVYFKIISPQNGSALPATACIEVSLDGMMTQQKMV